MLGNLYIVIDNKYVSDVHVCIRNREIKAYNNVNHEIEQGFGTCSLICLKERGHSERF